MKQKVQDMTEETFKTQVNSVMTDIAEKDKNLGEEFGRHWSEICQHQYKFDRQQHDIALLNTLTL